MATITVPSELAKSKDLVAVPRHTYEEFLAWLKRIKSAKTFKPTKAELQALVRGRKNLARGNYVTLEELENELGRSR
ncbi:MAG: hypothetical protein Q8R12_00120 [bacterium]|nr:hypothetical protein [bacterium]